MENHRRKFIEKSAVTVAGMSILPGMAWSNPKKAENSTVKSFNPFIGVQLDKAAYENRGFPDLFNEMQELAAINTVIYFFKDEDAKYGDNYHGGTQFRRRQAKLDNQDRDTIDLMQEAAAPLGMDIYMGGGEISWASCLGQYEEACQIDCYGEKWRFSCVNKPEWRKFQVAVHTDLFRQHPYLSGFLFMHERNGAFMPLLKPDTWRGDYNPVCFCESCVEKAKQQGIDAEKARAGFKKLVRLFKHKEEDLVLDGVMVGFWRILTEYPEVMAWEKLQWDSFQDYRKEIVKGIKEIKKDAKIGYHFQHHGLYGALPWRAGDKVEYTKEFADWVKPSVYPGASGMRYKDLLNKARETYLNDLDEETAHRVMSGWFNRSPENGIEMIKENPAEQSRFQPEWVESEVRRISEGAEPLPTYAGLGIGVPGGENVETPEFIAECTRACFRGGAEGIILSRHYSEMKPELVKASGEVIREYFKINH